MYCVLIDCKVQMVQEVLERSVLHRRTFSPNDGGRGRARSYYCHMICHSFSGPDQKITYNVIRYEKYSYPAHSQKHSFKCSLRSPTVLRSHGGKYHYSLIRKQIINLGREWNLIFWTVNWKPVSMNNGNVNMPDFVHIKLKMEKHKKR